MINDQCALEIKQLSINSSTGLFTLRVGSGFTIQQGQDPRFQFIEFIGTDIFEQSEEELSEKLVLTQLTKQYIPPVSNSAAGDPSVSGETNLPQNIVQDMVRCMNHPLFETYSDQQKII